MVTEFREKTLYQWKLVIKENSAGIKMHDFSLVGKALDKINELGLYKLEDKNFQSWCKEQYGISAKYATNLIMAYKVYFSLKESGIKQLPTHENQAIPLYKLSNEQRVRVWNKAIEFSKSEDPTERYVKRALRECNKEDRIKRIDEVIKNNKKLGVNKYPIILADPPWKYSSGTTDPRRIIENHYPTMDLEEICDMDIGNKIASDNAVLFLWATSPLIKEALQVMEAWGFKYKSQFIWNKERLGMGYWARGQHELLLIGIKGNPPRPLSSVVAPSIINEKRTQHSVKPVKVYEIIENYYPGLQKIELFARHRYNRNWSIWGNQLLKDKLIKEPDFNSDDHNWKIKNENLKNSDNSVSYICCLCGCIARRYGKEWPPRRVNRFKSIDWQSCKGAIPGTHRRYCNE